MFALAGRLAAFAGHAGTEASRVLDCERRLIHILRRRQTRKRLVASPLGADAKMIQHIVLFRWKGGVSADAVKAAIA